MKKGVARERHGFLLKGLFKILQENPEGIQAKDAIAQLADRITLTDHEAGNYASGSRRFDKIVRFGTVAAVKAGWMRKSKGIWTITEAGERALVDFPEPHKLATERARLYRKWAKEQSDDTPEADEPDQEASAVITLEEAEEQAWSEINAYLETIDPYDLQDLIAALLEGMGYHVSWVSPPGKDAGLDIVAFTDPLGTKPPRIKVQVKRRKDAIRVDELRSFLALINQDDVGIFVTTGSFTKDAEMLSRQQENRKITLINGIGLVDLWIEYQDKIHPNRREALPLKPVYFLNPRD